MNPFAGKNPTERNKIIAAIVLGFVALTALYLAFGRSIFSGSTTVAVGVTPTPKPPASPSANKITATVPSEDQEQFISVTTPIDYRPEMNSAADPGRNIFAFYEPAKPCPQCPQPPAPVKPIPTPTP